MKIQVTDDRFKGVVKDGFITHIKPTAYYSRLYYDCDSIHEGGIGNPDNYVFRPEGWGDNILVEVGKVVEF